MEDNEEHPFLKWTLGRADFPSDDLKPGSQKPPLEEISLNTRMARELTSSCINTPSEYAILSQGFPGTCSRITRFSRSPHTVPLNEKVDPVDSFPLLMHVDV